MISDETYKENLKVWISKVLKGSPFLLLRNYDTLDPGRKKRLNALFQANYPLYYTHSMKEQLRLFWEKKDKESTPIFTFSLNVIILPQNNIANSEIYFPYKLFTAYNPLK